ncbi:parallel beta-helix repeat protein [Methanococcus voltae]|uniref:right-handed parallel beta-helix repeat-containing protein n=1 Tax=Methanococcus voltae TaxID=2188 RepID=UPI001AE9D473|nr:right-handed parallel beta-helix repeat-containing protein [Methanococcus voltae]MBP2144019.1 parallel beta-helix repeat protein [Methanococcus voltae]
MKNSTLSILILSLLLFVLGGCSGVGVPEPDVTYHITINEPGIHTFDEDLILSEYKHGILINASNVTIDGNNFKLIGYNNHNNIGIGAARSYRFSNIEIKNLNISNFSKGIFIEDGSNISVHNCELFSNTDGIIVYYADAYIYLNTIDSTQGSMTNLIASSPKAVYEYNGKEYTYRLGNYYTTAPDLNDTDNDGVLEGMAYLGRMYDPYSLKEAPSNYIIKELYYPTVENSSPGVTTIIDIFALAQPPEYYNGKVTPEPTPEPEPEPTPSSGGSGAGTIYKAQAREGTSEGFTSQKIKDRVTLSKVIADDPLDADLAKKQLKDNIIGSDEDMSLNEDAVIIGGPVSNAFANKYNHMFEKPVTNDYPGENTGVIQVLKVQEEAGGIVQTHYIVYIAGSDRYGTQAAVEYFKTLTELPDEPILVKWVDGKPVLVE